MIWFIQKTKHQEDIYHETLLGEILNEGFYVLGILTY